MTDLLTKIKHIGHKDSERHQIAGVTPKFIPDDAHIQILTVLREFNDPRANQPFVLQRPMGSDLRAAYEEGWNDFRRGVVYEEIG
jgi:hypothetical protein